MEEVNVAAWSAVAAYMSILTEVQISYWQDGDELLETIIDTGWRLRDHKRARFTGRMASLWPRTS